MSGARRRHWWHGPALFAAASALLYAAGNVLVVQLVAVLHHLELHLDVVDARTGAPLPGASFAWAGRNPLAATYADGVHVVRDILQEQPGWVWPKVGTFAFAREVLEVAAPGCRTARIPLADALPALPYARPSARLRVALEPD